jgi:hypothetical protein
MRTCGESANFINRPTIPPLAFVLVCVTIFAILKFKASVHPPHGIDINATKTNSPTPISTKRILDTIHSRTQTHEMNNPSAYPSDLPERSHAPAGANWKARNCPNMRSCWSISLSSYSLKTTDKAVLARRICMLIILGLRTAISVLSIIGHAFGGRVLSLVIGSVLAVLGFLFIAWCLATIGDAKGYRKVLGLRVVSLRRSSSFMPSLLS